VAEIKEQRGTIEKRTGSGHGEVSSYFKCAARQDQTMAKPLLTDVCLTSS